MNIEMTDKDIMVLKLLHYFITEQNYSPVIVHGVQNEIWLENMDSEYKIVRIVSNYILNDEQMNFDIFKTKRIVKSIKRKTFNLNMNVLNIFTDLGDDVKLVNVLTGFKYIGEQIKLLEEKNKESNFVFGLEESYGYLRGTYTRDKDAVVASMLIALMTAECKNDGISLADKLTSLYEKYGYYAENMETITLPGISGGEKINEIMEKLRNGALQDDFVKIEDYNHDGGALPKSNVLKLYTDSGDYVAVRPSGTEPKIKFYFGVCSDSYEKSMDKLQKLKNRVLSVITIGNSDMRE